MAYPTKLVSVTKTGVAGNGHSGIDGSVSSVADGTVSLVDDSAVGQSSDGRFVVFSSNASNFGTSDTNADIFLKDMLTGNLTQVAQAPNKTSSHPDVSDDGRYVVMQIDNVIWMRDMTQNVLQAVSKNAAGTLISGVNPEMSNDGRYVVFNSNSGDGGSAYQQVYLRDMLLETTTLVSAETVNNNLIVGNADSTNAHISEDGKFVVFESASSVWAAETQPEANNIAFSDVFMKNIETGELTRVSETAAHLGGAAGASINASFSANGRYVVFESAANDLDSITNMAGNSTIVSVIYRKDLLTGNVDLVSEGKSGKASGWDTDPSISADGRFVLFKSHLGGAGDTALNGGATPLSPSYYSYYYIKDMATGAVYNIDQPRGSFTQIITAAGHTVVSPTTYVGMNPYESYSATISADGKHVTLSSIQSLDKANPTAYVTSINADNGTSTTTPDSNFKGNNDHQFDVFSIDVSSIASKAATAVVVSGTTGADILAGRSGADTLSGGLGNDAYFVDLISTGTGAAAVAKLKEIVQEAATIGSGDDTITLIGKVTELSKATLLSLVANVENFDISRTQDSLLNIAGNASANKLTGNLADNVIAGGAGADTLIGGAGKDTADYSTSLAAVTVNLALNTASGGDAVGDTFTSIENVTGSSKDDALTGDGNANVLSGGAGNDTLAGRDGDDTLVGGAGSDSLDGGVSSDTADYSTSALGVTVNLTANTASGGDAAGDTLTSIENVTGSAKNDVLTGDANYNVLKGGLGNDTLIGGGSFDDLYGGGGNDTYQITDSSAMVYEDLGGGTDQIISTVGFNMQSNAANVENLTLTGGTNGTGNDIANIITGNGGNNYLIGNGGVDTLIGGDGNDTYEVRLIQVGTGATASFKLEDTITELASQGTGDTLLLKESVGFLKATTITLAATLENLNASNATGLLNLTGNASANSILGNGSDNILVGGAGADALDGGGGNDTADYSTSSVGVTIDLTSILAATGGDAAGDTFNSIENLTGSSKVDSLTGDGGANVLRGGLGADILNGGAGIDTVDYSTSALGVTVNLTANTASGGDATGDTISNFENITGSAKNDALTGDPNANTLIGGLGNDTLDGGTAGLDHLWGGIGNDVFIVTNANATVHELANEGTDLIQATFTKTLDPNIENLTLTGLLAINGTGNELANTLVGNDVANSLSGLAGADALKGGLGNDTLSGGLANDTLTGGAGLDTFVFNSALAGNVDHITDFKHVDDVIWLSKSVFATAGNIGFNPVFHAGAGLTAGTTLSDRIIYNTTTGDLYYDADGKGGAAAVKFAVVDGHPTVDNTDFLITA